MSFVLAVIIIPRISVSQSPPGSGPFQLTRTQLVRNRVYFRAKLGQIKLEYFSFPVMHVSAMSNL